MCNLYIPITIQVNSFPPRSYKEKHELVEVLKFKYYIYTMIVNNQCIFLSIVIRIVYFYIHGVMKKILASQMKKYKENQIYLKKIHI